VNLQITNFQTQNNPLTLQKNYELRKILDYLLGGIYALYFGILLCVFHVVQVIAYTVFGPKVHQGTVEVLNFFIVGGFILTGSRAKFSQKEPIPEGRTILFISNHQSMFDIPGIIWFLRKFTPKFVSKKELAKGIPSISYNLRVGQAALIDRSDSKQAIMEILRFAKYISEHTYSAAIFPEGTRSRTGKLKPFAVGGVATLLKKCKDPLVVPIAIQNTGKFNPTGFYPLRAFTTMSWNTLDVMDPNGMTPEEVVQACEEKIREYLAKNDKRN
jgi:1-acyl-sn-glycerol-3-phosphate acyltransferase